MFLLPFGVQYISETTAITHLPCAGNLHTFLCFFWPFFSLVLFFPVTCSNFLNFLQFSMFPFPSSTSLVLCFLLPPQSSEISSPFGSLGKVVDTFPAASYPLFSDHFQLQHHYLITNTTALISLPESSCLWSLFLLYGGITQIQLHFVKLLYLILFLPMFELFV